MKQFEWIFISAILLMMGLGACQSRPEYCTVKGTIKGVKEGTKLALQDEYDHFKVIETARVKDGAFEFHPGVSGPTHVYLYTEDEDQLKDFFLEPGTIIVDVDAEDKEDYATGATGTPSNDLRYKLHQLDVRGDDAAYETLLNEVLDADETGILALYYADGRGPSAVRGLGALERLTPELAAMPFVANLREALSRRAKTEPAPEGSDSPNYFIDLDFPDVDGNVVRLGSVVNNPANRLVLLDFWATWCSPCRESIPVLKELYAKYHDKGLEIYSVSEDVREQNWKNFLPESGMTWINVRDSKAGRENSQAWFDYALSGIPTMLLIDGETGAILLRDHEEELDTLLSSLLQ